MKTVTVPKSKLKPKLLEYLTRAESGAEEICVTDHGEPVAKIVSTRIDEEEELAALRGLVVVYDGPLEPVDEAWEASS